MPRTLDFATPAKTTPAAAASRNFATPAESPTIVLKKSPTVVLKKSPTNVLKKSSTTVLKKMALLVATVPTGKGNFWFTVANSSLENIKACAQVKDCVCLLTTDGCIQIAAFYQKGFVYGHVKSPTAIASSKKSAAFDLDEPVRSIQACGHKLLATGESGKFYLFTYQGNGRFTKPLDFFMRACQGIALGPNFISGFDADSKPVLHILDLNEIAVTKENAPLGSAVTASILPKSRSLSIKNPKGRDPSVFLSFNKEHKGKLYKCSDDKLKPVSEVTLLCLLSRSAVMNQDETPSEFYSFSSVPSSLFSHNFFNLSAGRGLRWRDYPGHCRQPVVRLCLHYRRSSSLLE
jgi:hypothetical protein